MGAKKTNTTINDKVAKVVTQPSKKNNKTSTSPNAPKAKSNPIALPSSSKPPIQKPLAISGVNVAPKKDRPAQVKKPIVGIPMPQKSVGQSSGVIEGHFLSSSPATELILSDAVVKGVGKLVLSSPQLFSNVISNNLDLEAHDSSKTQPLVELPIRRKVLRRFYEPLIILHALDPCRGDRIEEFHEASPPATDVTQLRRSFIKYLAYICDYEKGGDTCTAIALEQCSKKVHFWVAANDSVKPKTFQFLKNSLEDLAQMTGHTRECTKEKILKRTVAFGRARVKEYLKLLQNSLPACIGRLSQRFEGKLYLVIIQCSSDVIYVDQVEMQMIQKTRIQGSHDYSQPSKTYKERFARKRIFK